MPFVLRNSGLVLGLMLWALVAVMTDYAMIILIRCGIATGTDSYQVR